MLKCSNCGLSVIIIDGQIIKVCHCDSPIIAEMSATANGYSSMERSSKEQPCQDLEQSRN